jgi:hypothetical protein
MASGVYSRIASVLGYTEPDQGPPVRPPMIRLLLTCGHTVERDVRIGINDRITSRSALKCRVCSGEPSKPVTLARVAPRANCPRCGRYVAIVRDESRTQPHYCSQLDGNDGTWIIPRPDSGWDYNPLHSWEFIGLSRVDSPRR